MGAIYLFLCNMRYDVHKSKTQISTIFVLSIFQFLWQKINEKTMWWGSGDRIVSESTKNSYFFKKKILKFFFAPAKFSEISKILEFFRIFIMSLSFSFECYIVCWGFPKRSLNLAHPNVNYLSSGVKLNYWNIEIKDLF